MALKEKYLKQEEIKGEHITKLLLNKLQQIQPLVKHTCTTELTGMKENYTIEVK